MSYDLLKVLKTTQPDTLLNMLKDGGYSSEVDRIEQLYKIVEEDPNNEPPISLRSLKSLTIFFLSSELPIVLKYPNICIDPNGYLQAEWKLESVATTPINLSGVVNMAIKFPEKLMMRYAIILGSPSNHTRDVHQIVCDGHFPLEGYSVDKFWKMINALLEV